MQLDAPTQHDPHTPSRAYFPLLVLAASLLLTAATAFQVQRAALATERVRYARLIEGAIDRIHTNLQQRQATFVALLQGVGGMYAAAEGGVTLDQFRLYLGHIDLRDTYRGVHGIGFAKRVTQDRLAIFEQSLRDEGLSDYRVWPAEPPREEYFPIKYLEPLDQSNRRALGYDMYHDVTRREAMERARDAGAAAATGRVTLVQEPESAGEYGFLIYYPVYQNGIVPETIEGRREELRGFVYSPFRINGFLRGVLADHDEPAVDFAVYDGTVLTEENLMRPADRAHGLPLPGSMPVRVEVAGRTWTLVFDAARPPPSALNLSRAAIAAAAGGAAVSLLLFALARAQTNARRDAERNAAELRRSSQEVRRREEQFRLVTDSLPVLVAYIDRDHRYRFNNRAYEKFFGRPRSELPGAHLRDAVGEAQYARILPYVERALAGEQVSFDLEYDGPEGGQRFDNVTYVPHRAADGGVLGFVALSADITDRKLADRERVRLLAREQEARADAEAANRSKDEFLATLSHELRTPLNAILGWAQLLRIGALPADEVSQGLETIERNAKAQAQLVEDLLDLSRIISGKLRLEVRPVDLVAVVEGALDSLRPAAEAKGIRVVPVLDAHAGPVLGDTNRLQQVAWNLLSNAIKFTPRGGRVDVWLCGTDLDAELTISDTGAGVRRDFLPHVFDRLRQADATTTRRHGGLGLGLAIVRHLIELHGGTVAADSAGEGRGATFTVRLPLSKRRRAGGRPPRESIAPHQDGPTATPRGQLLQGVEVLVVDDEPDAREMFQVGLEQCGARVAVAASAAEAMLAVGGHVPDVVLSDISMPDEDGYSLIARIRRRSEADGGNVPAIAVTAFARAEDRARALEAGFQEHVSKPIEPSKLATIVAGLAARSRRAEEAAADATGL